MSSHRNKTQLLILSLGVGVVAIIGIVLITINSFSRKNLPQQPPLPHNTPITKVIGSNVISRLNSQSSAKYEDKSISFNFPKEWIDSSQLLGAPTIVNLHFFDSTCSKVAVSFYYHFIDLNNANELVLGQKNPYGPSGQISRIIKMNGIEMGENNQIEGDGSGGYEPKVQVDFLSPSKKLHYYFRAVQGCRNSHEETYQKDLLPILKTIKLSDSF